jgi:excisionase family DNA binding protein
MSIASTGLTTWENPGHTKNVASSRGPPDRAAFSPAETSELLGLSEATVYRILKRGDLPSVLIGGSRRIPAAAIHKLLTAHATPEAA